MATSNPPITDEKPVQLVSKEGVKKELEVPVEFETLGQCVLCVSNTIESFDIFTHTTASRTPLHIFISSYTNTELPFCVDIPKYICKTCVDLINDLELAKIEYIKLKNSFDRIISENPLFHLSQHTNGEESQSNHNQGISKWALDKVMKVEPMSVNESASNRDTEQDTKMSFAGRETRSEDVASNTRQVLGEKDMEINSKMCLVHSATQTGGMKQYECAICHRWFNTKGQLKTHSITHTGDKPFECNVCQRRFSLKGNLRSHMRIHTGEKPYNCDLCQRQFSELTNFRYHVRTHTGEKPFECDVCHTRFTVKTHLKAHLRKHTGERPHHCHICQRGYVERRSLERHLKTHARKHTSEKSHQCSICQRLYAEKRSLERHLKRSHVNVKS